MILDYLLQIEICLYMLEIQISVYIWKEGERILLDYLLQTQISVHMFWSAGLLTHHFTATFSWSPLIVLEF